MPGLAAATLLNLTGHAPAPHHHPDCVRCDARTTKQAYAHVPRYPSLAATSSDYRPSRRCKKGPVTQLVQSQHQRHPTRVQRFGRRIERATQRGTAPRLSSRFHARSLRVQFPRERDCGCRLECVSRPVVATNREPASDWFGPRGSPGTAMCARSRLAWPTPPCAV